MDTVHSVVYTLPIVMYILPIVVYTLPIVVYTLPIVLYTLPFVLYTHRYLTSYDSYARTIVTCMDSYSRTSSYCISSARSSNSRQTSSTHACHILSARACQFCSRQISGARSLEGTTTSLLDWCTWCCNTTFVQQKHLSLSRACALIVHSTTARTHSVDVVIITVK